MLSWLASPRCPKMSLAAFTDLTRGIWGSKNGSLCATRVPGRAAQMIDDRMDDGRIDRGRVVATSRYDPADAKNHFDAPDSDPYDIEKEYIICAPILP